MITVGQRVFVASHETRGTVRWAGQLPGLEMERVGVELDENVENSSDGKYLGINYFEPIYLGRSKFFKLNSISFGVALADAIEFRYRSKADLPPKSSSILNPILVGAEAAETYWNKSLFDRTEICLDNCQVSSALSGLGNSFAFLSNISLTDNLVSDFRFLIDLVKAIPTLTEINLSRNALQFNDNLDDVGIEKSLTVLKLNETLLPFTVFAKLGIFFPSLFLVEFSGNAYSLSDGCVVIDSLKSLAVSNCGLTSWPPEGYSFPNLTSLNVSKNGLTSVDWPVRLEQLNIAECQFNSWQIVKTFQTLKLRDLRVTDNPFYPLNGRQILTTVFPLLTLLNGATISEKQRIEANRYCRRAKWDCADVRDLLPSVDEPSHVVVEKVPDGRTVRKTLIQLSAQDEGGKRVEFRVPESCSISDLTKLVARKINWPLKLTQLRLSASPPNSNGMEDRVSLDVINSDLIDLGVESGWLLYASVNDVL